MGEFFKDGAYRISSDQKGDLKEFLLERMRKLNNRTKTGKLSKEGTNTKTFIDGEEFVFKSQGNDAWSWRNKAGIRAITDKRDVGIATQTVGKKDFPKSPSKALEIHHQRMVALYAPLYEGLTEAEGLELSRYFAEDLNMPLGNKLANASTLPMKPHDDIHEFIDKNFRGKNKLPNWSDPKYNRMQLPDGEILEGLDARKFHAKNFFADLMQPVIDEKTMSIMQDFAGNNPKRYKGLYKNHLLSNITNSRLAKGLNKLSGKTRRADLVAQTVSGAATGNVVQAGVAGTTLAMTEALKSPAAQKAIAKQIAEITAKRGAKTAAKLIPGLDIVISGAETWGYLKQGKLDQAGIAALSGAIGWIPVVGDGASAVLDLTNTGIDISRLSSSGTGGDDIDMTEGGKVRKYESGVIHSATGQGDQAFDNVVNALKENPNRFDSSGFGQRINVEDLAKQLSRFNL